MESKKQPTNFTECFKNHLKFLLLNDFFIKKQVVIFATWFRLYSRFYLKLISIFRPRNGQDQQKKTSFNVSLPSSIVYILHIFV